MITTTKRIEDLVNAIWQRRVGLVRYASSMTTLLVGQAANLLGFVVLARWLGVDQFGQLMTITAATSLAASLCGFGAGESMIRRVAREHTLYPVLFGHSLILILASGAVLTMLTVGVLSFLIHASPVLIKNLTIIFLFAISNIMLFSCISLTEQIFIAHWQFMRANMVNAAFAITRMLTTILACGAFGVDRLETWALWHCAAHLVGAFACIAAVRSYGKPKWRLLREEVGLGVHISLSQAVDVLRQNVDRLVLATVVPPATVGVYSVASRIVATSMLTVHSLTRILYPRLAVVGEAGLSASSRRAIYYLPAVLSVAGLASLGQFLFADIFVWLFGKDYADMALYLRILCWLPILVAMQSIAIDALRAAEKHGIAAHIFNANALLVSALIAWATWKFGLAGTFFALYVSQACLSGSLWIALVHSLLRPIQETVESDDSV